MPTDPLTLQVADRFEAVLDSIEAGTNYFYTPQKVSKYPLDFEDAKFGNLYEVFVGEEAGSFVEVIGREAYDATFFITVVGTVFDRSDLVTKLIKSWRDVVYAIDQDSKSSTAGTLGVLGVQVRVDEGYEASYYAEGHDGFANFKQKFRCQISGDLGDL